MNLVGPGDTEIHFDDADAVALALRALATRRDSPLSLGSRWADLGSGAGFPGIALAAHHSDLQVDLVESREKRVTFLRHVIRASKLPNTQVIHGRVEGLELASYDGVISRAFAPPERYLPLAADLISTGGCVVLLSNTAPDHAISTLTEFHVERYVSGGKNRLMTVYRKL